MPERTYTTHDIAKFCDVYPSSVVNWIDDGRLKAYSTPGGHHRVTREDLLAFLAEFRIPIPNELTHRPARILVVDDDEEVTAVIARAFARRAEEFEVEVCHGGIEALIRIGQAPPDLVVLDIVLPRMDGLQVCRVLKSKPETRDIKIVAISGKKPPFNEKKPSDAGIDAFLRKPLDLFELVSEVESLVGARVPERTRR